jgi:hypothetical protein
MSATFYICGVSKGDSQLDAQFYEPVLLRGLSVP